MTMVVLHLSDIHIKHKSDPILTRAKNIAACIYASLPEASTVFILVSGDVAFAGKPEQYTLAQSFLGAIAAQIREEKSIPVRFILCPGNHDCDFDSSSGLRKLAIDAVNHQGGSVVDESVIKECCSVQKPFFEFAMAMNKDYAKSSGDSLWQTLSYEVGAKDLVFDCINVAWMSQLHEQPGTLVIPHERYLTERQGKAELRIAVMHHPLNWLSQHMYRDFRKALRRYENVVFTGHEHLGNVGENIDAESGHSAYVEGCVLQGEKDLSDSGFNVVVFDLSSGTYKSSRYQWAGSLYEASEEGSWADYRDIPVKTRSPLQLKDDFRQLISDPGASFKRLSGHEICLSDIYVYPDLMGVVDAKDVRRVVSSEILTDPKRLEEGVLLQGEEKVGTTSLLYQLLERYGDRGFAPLFLNAIELRGSTPRDVDAWIRASVSEQYGVDAGEKYAQIEKAKKVALVDNFDECPMKAAAFKARAISALRARFGHLVVAVGELFDLQEVLTNLEDETRRALQQYRIVPFGYSLRSKLIRRWFSLGARDGSLDEAALLERRDQAEKIMDTAMVRNIIPSLPLYLLTLLQSIDAGQSGQFQESALGNYYMFLVNEGMRAARIAPSRWDELTEYCADLAWHFHKCRARELPKHSLFEFNQRFSVDRHTVDFDTRLSELLSARILVEAGDAFRFRYHYTYYLLKGRYMTRNLADKEVTSYIEQCCKHLYVRDNANTILFMAHHQAGQPLIMDKIVATLDELFKGHSAATLSREDTKGIQALVRELPKLEYSGESPEKDREEIHKLRDELDDGRDGLADRVEDGEDLSVHAQVVMVLKTVEILGQLLKNQYAALSRTRRVEVLAKLFNGPLRALRGYFDFLGAKPDAIVAEIDAALRDRAAITDVARRERIARETVALVVQLTALGFVLKAASSVGAESLLEDIRTVTKENDTAAFRLIELAVALDTVKKLPRDKIDALVEETEGNLVPRRLLQFLVLRHLYMFRTSEQEKQWLASKSVVAIRTQQAIDMKTLKAKKLKQPRSKR